MAERLNWRSPHVGLLAITVESVLEALASLDEARPSMSVTNSSTSEVRLRAAVGHAPG